MTELLFPDSNESAAATTHSTVALLLIEQIKYCLDDSSSTNKGQHAAKAFLAVDAAVKDWPSADAETLLTQLAAGLIAAAGKDAEQVTEALVKAASAEQRPPIMAAIALAAADLDASSALILAAVNAAPSAERNALRKIAATPLEQLGEGADAAINRIVKAFQLLREHWTSTDKPTVLFQDSDGGEPPASRP